MHGGQGEGTWRADTLEGDGGQGEGDEKSGEGDEKSGEGI